MSCQQCNERHLIIADICKAITAAAGYAGAVLGHARGQTINVAGQMSLGVLEELEELEALLPNMWVTR